MPISANYKLKRKTIFLWHSPNKYFSFLPKSHPSIIDPQFHDERAADVVDPDRKLQHAGQVVLQLQRERRVHVLRHLHHVAVVRHLGRATLKAGGGFAAATASRCVGVVGAAHVASTAVAAVGGAERGQLVLEHEHARKRFADEANSAKEEDLYF